MECPIDAGRMPGYYIGEQVGGAARRPRRRKVPAVRRRTDALRKAVRELISHVKQPTKPQKKRLPRRPTPRPKPRAAKPYDYLRPRTSQKHAVPPPVRPPKPVDRVVMIDRDSVWRGAQVPQPTQVPIFMPPWMAGWPPNFQQTVNNTTLPGNEVRDEPEEAQVFRDARDVAEENYVPRRPADGEADQDVAVQRRWSFDQVVKFLERIPKRGRKLILTGLFGTAVGVVLDLLLGSPLNLTTRLLRLIVGFVPGGSLILNSLDALGYLLGKFQSNPLQITYDPGFQNLANNIQQNLPQGTAGALLEAAETQLGAGFMRNVAAAFSYLVANAPSASATAAAVPLAMVRPFRP